MRRLVMAWRRLTDPRARRAYPYFDRAINGTFPGKVMAEAVMVNRLGMRR